jgi:hypothetical protein
VAVELGAPIGVEQPMLEALGVEAVDLGVVERAVPFVDDIAVTRHDLHHLAVDRAGAEDEPRHCRVDDPLRDDEV